MILEWMVPTIAHKKITKPIPKLFQFGNSSTKVTETNSQNISVRKTEGFGNPLLSTITETYWIRKQFCSEIPERELPKSIQNQ